MKPINTRLTLIIIAATILTINVAYSAKVWSDDFDDRDFNGWTTEILDWDLGDAFTGEPAEFDLSEGTLKAPEGTPGNIWYLANHPSTVEYGEWSFDVKIVDTDWMHFYVFLMTDDWAEYPLKSYSYDIVFSTEQGYPEPDSKAAIDLFKRDGWRYSWDTIGEWSTSEDLTGWHHVNVTRDEEGVFDVYFDNELIIHVEDDDPQSGMFNTFRFEASSGPELDNIVVSDFSEAPSSSGGIPGFSVWSLVFGLVVINFLHYIRKQ